MPSPTLTREVWAALRRPRPSDPTKTFAASMPSSRLLVLVAVAQVWQDHPTQLGVRVAQVAEYTGLHPTTVSQHLAALYRVGWLRKYGNRPLMYRIEDGHSNG